MKKEYRLAIEKQFTTQLKRIDPEFKKVPVKVACNYDGEATFAKKLGEVTLFITVIPNPKGYEEFSIELGWSTKNHFPDLKMRPNIYSTIDVEEFKKDEGMIRLTLFSKMSSFGWKFRGIDSEINEKYFSGTGAMATTPKEIIEQDLKRKPTPNEATEAVAAAVNEAISELKKNGFPYLYKYVMSNNLAVHSDAVKGKEHDH